MAEDTASVLAPRVTSAAELVLKEYNMLGANPFFIKLKDGGMGLEQFKLAQEQFYFAVLFFARPMAALVARYPDPRSRLDILHNVVEEHGDFDERFFHESTFKEFLKSIGGDITRLETIDLWPEVRAFNSVLAASCVLDEIEVATATIGIIEFAFADISAFIGQAVVKNGWVKADQLKHYKTHAEIDRRHAQELFVAIENLWDTANKKYLITQGLSLGAYIFSRLYRDLFERSQVLAMAIDRSS